MSRVGRPAVTVHGSAAYTHHGCRCGVCRAARRSIQTRYNATERGRASKRAGAARLVAKRQAVIRAAKDRPCMDCGVQYAVEAMEFDHRPSETKLMTLGSSGRNQTEARILAEVAKCDVVCANCHRVRTVGRRGVR